ncbi:MAG: cobalamin-dependent protein [Hyphomicrobiales bacterium]|nr:cobalamin-dependent protein [Hyphomicrobiales bacterium]
MTEPSLTEAKYDYKTCFDKGYEMLAGVFGDGSDEVPFIAQMSEFCMAYQGINGKEFYSNPEVFVEGNLRTSAELGFDVADLIWDVYDIECEATGGKMSWFDELSPAINNTVPLISTEKDLAKLTPPDPAKSGRMPFVRDVLQLFHEKTGKKPTLRYCGPLTCVAQYMQFEQMILRMEENPEFVHKVFKFVVEEVQAPYLNYLFDLFPDGGCNGSDAIGSLPFITEEILDEFSIPNILKLRKLCGDRDVVQVDNWWGDSFAENTERYWEKKLAATPNYLKIQDPDLFKVGTQRGRNFATERGVPLQFGVDNHVLQEGPEEEIVKRIHEYLEVGSSGPLGNKFFLYFCNLSAQTPVEHAKIAVDAVKRWRAGDRPYEGQIFSGPDGVSAARSGEKGQWMGITNTGDIEGNLRAALDTAAKEGKKQIFVDIYESVMEFRDDDCATLVAQALDAGETPIDILDEGLIAAMGTIGDLFGSGELFVPEMLIAARAMKAGLAVLEPILTASDEPPKGTVLMATVQGDLHDIGKNLVAMMLEGAGFKIVDLGVNTDPQLIIEKADEIGADIIGLSALLTTSMPFMKITIEAFKSAGKDYPIIVGGAPVTRDYAEFIGADGYADNASEAVLLCKDIVSKAEKTGEVAVELAAAQ